MSEAPKEPDESTAIAVASQFLPDPVRVARFPTGLQHFVFEATSGTDGTVVVRISRREEVSVARNSCYWSDLLRPLGVPLPRVLHADFAMERHPFPFVILERLPGRDLGFVIDRLPHDALRRLARRLADVQAIVTDLPPGLGYGFAPRMEGPFPQASWRETVAASLSRSRKRICDAGLVSDIYIGRVEAAADRYTEYFASVPATPFLHDITTKNVIVDGSHLSGIVDVDSMCFGDPLFLVGLIRMALLAHGHAVAYADAWVEALRLDMNRRKVIDFYTALHCIGFMAEIGHRFNRHGAAPPCSNYILRLQHTLDICVA